MNINKPLPKGWKRVKLGEVCEVKRGETITKKQTKQGCIPVIAGGRMPAYYHNNSNVNPPVITVSGSGAYAGYVNFFDAPIYASDCSTIRSNNDNVNLLYIYNLLRKKQRDIYELKQGSAQPHVYAKDLREIDVFLPPLTEQKRIVAKLDKQLATVEKAQQAAEKQLTEIKLFSAALLRAIFPTSEKLLKGWKWVELGEVCQLDKQTVLPNTEKWKKLSYIGLENIESESGNIINVSLLMKPSCSSFYFCNKHVLYCKLRPYLNKVALPDFEGICSSEAVPLMPSEQEINRYYLGCFLRQKRLANELMRHATGSRQPRASMERLLKIKIPLPPLSEQKRIVAKLDKQLATVEKARQAADKQLSEIKLFSAALLRESLSP